jgi:tetratricopeptide (TPR) repeat protein
VAGILQLRIPAIDCLNLLVREVVMSAKYQSSILRMTLACALFWVPAALAQSTPISSVQVTQLAARVRGSSPGDPSLPQAVSLGQSLIEDRRFAEAAELFTAIIEKKPNDPAALYGAALAAFNLGRLAEAESLVRSAVQILVPEDSGSGAALAKQQRTSAADALVLLAVVTAVRGNDSDSLQTAERAVKIAPDHFDAQFTLGRALFSVGDYAGSVTAFRKAIALNPNDTRALFFLGTSLERTDDVAGALASYRQLIAKQPSAAEGHLGCGSILVKRSGNEFAEGMRELERAIQINPNLYEARIELGRALVSKGRAAESIVHLTRAAELAPGNPEPHYQLSLAYRRLGRKQEAAQEEVIVKRIHETRRSGEAQPERRTP